MRAATGTTNPASDVPVARTLIHMRVESLGGARLSSRRRASPELVESAATARMRELSRADSASRPSATIQAGRDCSRAGPGSDKTPTAAPRRAEVGPLSFLASRELALVCLLVCPRPPPSSDLVGGDRSARLCATNLTVVRRALATVLAVGAATGVAVAAVARQDADLSRSTTPGGLAVPAPNAPIPPDPPGLADALTTTTRQLRDALARWGPAEPIPEDVTLLALYHQRILRRLASQRALGDATLARLPRDVRGEARDTVLARRSLAAIPRSRGRLPRVRIGAAAPAVELRRFYAAAQRRFGVHWSVLAAVNFVESAFGRLRNRSEAGARGPMQFLPSTWRIYGMGGDIDDPHDAILAAANYLRRSGAPRRYERALFAYNHSMHYVRAVRRFASRMRRDERTFLTYYAWQIYVRTAQGVRRITGPGLG
jgi:soluble lytic murein transglycosylase-like protein